jgi:hypothetical protein
VDQDDEEELADAQERQEAKERSFTAIVCDEAVRFGLQGKEDVKRDGLGALSERRSSPFPNLPGRRCVGLREAVFMEI